MDLATLLVAAPDDTLNLSAGTGPGAALAAPLSLLAGGPITLSNVTRTSDTALNTVGVRGVLNQLNLPIALRATVEPTTGKLQLEAELPAAWPLDLGPTRLQLANAKLLTTCALNGGATSSLSGELALGDALTLALTLNGDTAGGICLGATLPPTTPRGLVRAVAQHELPDLSIFDLPFDNGQVTIGREAGGLAFTATGTVGGVGLLLLIKASGVALGLGLDKKSTGLPAALKDTMQLCDLDAMLLVYSSYADTGFALTGLAPSGNSLALSGGLLQGLTAYASWELAASPNQKMLRRLLPALSTQLAVLLQLDPTLTGGSMQTGVSFAFNQKSSNPLTFSGNFGFRLKASKAELFLTGTMTTKLQREDVTFAVAAEFLPAGALLSGSMQGTVAFEPLPLKLSNPALVVGLSVEGIPSLGLAGALNVKDFQSSVAAFFDSTNPSRSMLAGSVSNLNLYDVLRNFTPQAPVPPELRGVLDKVTLTGTRSIELKDDDNALTDSLKARQLNKLAAAANPLLPPKQPMTRDVAKTLLKAGSGGSTWFLTDMSLAPPVHYELSKKNGILTVSLNPQFYFAPQDTQLGNLTFAQGLFFNAKLQFLGFEALANIRASLTEGLLAEGYLSPLVLGAPDLFSLTATSDPQKGAHLSLATYGQPQPASQAQLQNQLPPLALAVQQAQAARQAALQALRSATAAAQGRTTQAATSQAPAGAQSIWKAQQQQMQAARDQVAQAQAQANATQAQAALDRATAALAQAQAAFDQVAQALLPASAWKPHFLLDGQLTFLAVKRGIYASVSSGGIAFELIGTLYPGITASLKGSCRDPSNLRVGGGLLLGADGLDIDLGPLGNVRLSTGVQGQFELRVQPGANAPATVRTTATLSADVQALGRTLSLQQLALNVESPSLPSIQQQVVSALAAQLLSLLKEAGAWLEAVAKNLLVVGQEVGQVLKEYYGLSKELAAAAYAAASYPAHQAAQGLKAAYGVAKADIGDLLDKAGYPLAEIGGALNRAYGVLDPAEAGLLLGNVGRQLVNVFSGGIRIPGPPRATADQLTQALRTTYDLTKNNIVGVLAPVGYGLDDIGSVLRNTFSVTDYKQAAALLKTFPIDQLKNTLQRVYQVNNDQLAAALRAAGYGIQDIGNLLKDNCKLGYQDVARALQSAGYGFKELLDYIKDAFGFGLKDLAGLADFIKGLF